jgi:hypothetical protein
MFLLVNVVSIFVVIILVSDEEILVELRKIREAVEKVLPSSPSPVKQTLAGV